jgi:hypothetical protein
MIQDIWNVVLWVDLWMATNFTEEPVFSIFMVENRGDNFLRKICVHM